MHQRRGDPIELAATSFSEHNGEFSPDGNMIAYVSNEAGRNHVYVTDFPRLRERRMVSQGAAPRWSRTSDELFYRSGGKLMAVTIQAEPELLPETPVELFDYEYLAGGAPQYHVHPDGRFLMIRYAPEALPDLRIVTNWFEELKERVPTGR